jgi:hypothetical protein
MKPGAVHCLPITINDRLSLSPLHTNKFNTPTEVPSSNQEELNGYKPALLGTIS